MSLEATPRPASMAHPRPASMAQPRPTSVASQLPDDRRYSYTDFEFRSGRPTRLNAVSQNGVITFTDSDGGKGVALRRAQSLRDGRRKEHRKHHTVSFDSLPYDATITAPASETRQSPPVSARDHIPEEDEGEGFNAEVLRRSITQGLDKVRRLSGLGGPEERREGGYVRFQDHSGAWQKRDLRRTSQYEPCDHTFKVMLLGDSCVGKTCLLTRFKDGAFLSGSFISTIGIDFRNKVVTVDGSKVKLQIWDTAGQERFRSVTHAYYRDAHALLLLYDVVSKSSFDNTRAWLAEVHEYAQDDVVIMLIGNKCDVGVDRLVRREDGERLAREYNVAFMETSAKTGLNVDLAFMAVARQLKARKSNNPHERKFNVADYVRQEARHDACVCNVG